MTNENKSLGDAVYLPVPANYVSGYAHVIGVLPVVLITDRDSGGNASVKCKGIFDLTVAANNGSANVAVAAGDIIYLDANGNNANNTLPLLDKNASGKAFGIAMAAIANNSAATIIPVRVGPALL